MEPVPTPFNLADYVLRPALSAPDKPALQVVSPTGARRFSHGWLRETVARRAGGLRAKGLAPQAKVLMRLGNGPDFPLTYLAALWAGLIPVPTSPALTAPEITKIAKVLDPDLIVADAGIALPDHAASVIAPSDLEASAIEPELGDPDRPGYIIFTSGTSGRPRGVIHAHRAIWARRMMWDGWYGLREDDRLMHAGAFNWTYTLGTGLMDPWARGATALIPAPGVTPQQIPLLLKRFDVTIFAAAPGVYRQILKQTDMINAPALRHGLSAGEALPDVTRTAWEVATGTQIHEALGMTECSTFVSGSPARPAQPGTAGYPQPGRQVAALDADGAPQPADAPGTLAIHKDDPGLMLATLDGPLPLTGDWFLTGDTVSIGEDGAVSYLGRNDDMLNAGGFRVSPLEIEAALCAHPQVHEAAAVEHEVKAGTRVIAAHYTADAPLTDETLHAHCAERLARYKQPRMFTHHDNLPKSGNGKLNRKALRA